jgi:hypothetical protein
VACSPAGSDAVQALAVGAVARGLEQALAGWQVTTRTQLSALVRDSRDTVVDPERTDVGFGGIDYATYGTDDQELSEDDAVPLVVWHRTVGGGPFVDDGGRWHVVCARLFVDRSAAALVGEVVRCPGEVPSEPSTPSGDASARHLDLEAPGGGTLVTGDPPRQGAPAPPLRAAAPEKADPCWGDDLDLALGPTERLTGTDAAPLLVVNTGTLACRLGPVTDLVHSRAGERVPLRTALTGGEVVLAPRESARSLLTWRPSQRSGSAAPQRLSVAGPAGGELLPVRRGNPGTPGVLAVDPGADVAVSRWQRSGYGVTSGDGSRRPDVARECTPDELAVTSERVDPGSGQPPPPSVRVLSTAVTACRLRPGTGSLPGGLPEAVPAPVVVLAPGGSTEVRTLAPGPDRPGEVLVAGRWVRVRAATSG